MPIVGDLLQSDREQSVDVETDYLPQAACRDNRAGSDKVLYHAFAWVLTARTRSAKINRSVVGSEATDRCRRTRFG